MSKKNYNNYLFMLEISLSYICECYREWNNNLGNIYSRRKLEYHFFSFSQIIYALKERLVSEFQNEKETIEEFFNSPSNSVGLIKELANEWKHENSMDIRTAWEVKQTEPFKKVSFDEKTIDEISQIYNLKNEVIKEIIFKNKEIGLNRVDVSLAKLENPLIKLPKNHRLNKNDYSLLEIYKKAIEELKIFINSLTAKNTL